MEYSFTLFISTPNVDEETAANMLYESGCEDALFSVSEGVYSVDFDRESDSFDNAIASAIRDIKKSNIGSYIVSYEVTM